MKSITTLFLLCVCGSIHLFCQSNIQQSLSVNSDGAAPDASAIFDLKASDKGVLVPRLTTSQRNAVVAPATGLLVFDTDAGGFWFYTGSAWQAVGVSYVAGSGISLAGNTFSNSGDLSTSNELQNLSIVGNQLSISSGNSVTVPGVNYAGGSGISLAGDVISNTGDLSTSNELQNLSIVGNQLSISSGNSVTVPGVNYTAGTGISLAGNAIANTGDLSASNELQNLSIVGNQLSISSGNSVNLPSPVSLADADADTKIQVEETADEDKIRFDLAAAERWVMQGARLESVNSGQSVFLGENAGAADDLTTNVNAAVGYQALRFNTTGEENTAIGGDALYTNTVGLGNLAAGRSAMLLNLNGDYNVGCGYQALYSNTSGFENTAVGNSSLYYNTTGFGNTAVGSSASFTAVNLENTTCLGYLAGGVSAASNRVEIGNTSVGFIGGQVSFSTYSDARIKNRVQENVPGLDFIMRLRPVTYHLDIHKQNELCFRGKKASPDWASKYDIEQKRFTGFLAQEVETAAKAVGYDFSGVEKAADEVGLYSVRYSDFVMPLVKAVQEQQTEIGNLKLEIQAQQAEIERLKMLEAKVEKLMAAMK